MRWHRVRISGTLKNPGIKQIFKYFLLTTLLLFALLFVVLVSMQHWFGTDDFKLMVEREAREVLEVAVTLKHLELRPAWPGRRWMPCFSCYK